MSKKSVERDSFRPRHIRIGLGAIALLLPMALRAQSLLTAEEAARTARENSFRVRAAEENLRIAENNVTWGNAGLMPKLDLSAGYTGSINNARQKYASGDVLDRNGATASTVSSGVALNWTPFDGFHAFATHDKLKEQRSLATTAAEMSRESVVAQTLAAYYDIVRQQGTLTVLRRNAEFSEARLANVRSKYDVGENSKRELLPAQVDLNTDRSAALRQEVALRSAKMELNRLLARDPGTDFTVEDTIIVDTTLEMTSLKNDALAANTSLDMARIQRNVAALELREAESGWYPKLGLNLGYNFSNSETEAGFVTSNTNSGFTYGATASLNLFDGFNTNRQVENARVEIAAADLAIAETEQAVETALLQAYENYRNRIELMKLEEDNMKLAEENLSIAMERYKVGTIIALELRDAQNAMVAAESRLLTAQYDAKIAETELLRLSGRLSDGR